MWKNSKKLTLLPLALITCIILFGGTTANAQYPRFYVCLENSTANYVNYRVEWCTRAGSACTGSRTWTVAPYQTMEHWGPHGNGRMDVNIQTGGSGGIHMDYNLYGNDGGCSPSSTYVIRYNEKGFLRIYHKY
jgi:hypothetical protein